MSNQPNQREKLTEVVPVRATTGERQRMQEMANEKAGGNMSAWARQELVKLANSRVASKTGA